MESDSSRGDPNGKRLARRKAGLLEEAERVARVLEILLKRAEYPSESASVLANDLAKEQRIQLQKAYGRIEPRTRFKARAGQPLRLGLPINLLFVDESGKSEIQGSGYPPYFTLGAIAIGEAEAAQYCARADELKQSFFGRTDFQFHEPYMRRRTQTNHADYSFGNNSVRQEEFDKAIEMLIRETEFLTFGVAIRKSLFEQDFIDAGVDPYLPMDVYSVAITLLLERYVDALAHTEPQQMGRLRLESIGPKEDAYHQLEYARLLLEGSQWVSASAFLQRLETGLVFSPKLGSDPSELADFFARDLFEWIRGSCTIVPKWWEVFCSKVYVRGDGRMGKFGIKVFPDTDIRDKIDHHREKFGAVLE